MTENIEQEIAFAHKADAESFIVLWLGGTAIYTPAPEIHDAVKTRSIQRMNVGIHTAKLRKPGD
jgi:hypothetical protein